MRDPSSKMAFLRRTRTRDREISEAIMKQI